MAQLKYLKLSLTRWKILITVLVLGTASLSFVPQVFAANMTDTIVRFDNMTESAFTSGTVCAESPSAATATETSVKVTFPTNFTVSTTTSNWAVSTATTTSWPAGAVAWPGIAAPTGAGEFVISGQSVNFVSGNLTSATTLYCFNWTNTTAALTQPATPANNETGQVITQTTGGAASDTGNYATSTLSNDQVVVSATVPQTFTLALGGGSSPGNDNFTSNLSTGAIDATTGETATVTTNAVNGWYIWGADSNNGNLHSTTQNSNIASTAAGTNRTIAAGTTDYVSGLNMTTAGTGSGTDTPATAFNNATTSGRGGGLTSTPQIMVTSNGTASGDVATIKEYATIGGTVPPANDYSDTITFTGAGSF